MVRPDKPVNRRERDSRRLRSNRQQGQWRVGQDGISK